MRCMVRSGKLAIGIALQKTHTAFHWVKFFLAEMRGILVYPGRKAAFISNLSKLLTVYQLLGTLWALLV